MPRVFRQQYVRPIPEGAERVRATIRRRGRKLEVDAVRFRDGGGKWVTAPIVEAGKHAGSACRVPSPTWYGMVNGRKVPLCTNRAASEAMLADLVRKRERGEAGLTDPFDGHRKRPLSEHLADYKRELESRDCAPRYVSLVMSRLASLFAGCGFACAADFDAPKVTAWLADLRRAGEVPELPDGVESFRRAEASEALGVTPTAFRDMVKRLGLRAVGKGPATRYPRSTVEAARDRLGSGASVQTTNYYLSHLKSFCNWLVCPAGRLPAHPFAALDAGDTNAGRRHDRRDLTPGELRLLLAAARASKRVLSGLTGEDRYHLYACACGTGFRAGALASLTPSRFGLGGGSPTVTLSARANKSRRQKVQPLPAELAELLRGYLAGRPAEVPVWGGDWPAKGEGAEMLRADLADAGIPYAVDGPDGPLFADFHALRHSYLTALGRAGVDLRTAQELAGHSTPVLTARYTHVRLHDLAGAAGKLPAFLPEASALQATGTDGPGSPYPLLTHGPDGDCRFLTVPGTDGPEGAPSADPRNSLPARELRASA